MKWLTKDTNGKPLCNFVIRVVDVKDVRLDGVGERIPYIRVYFDFGEQMKKNPPIYEVLLSDIDKTHWKDLDNRCCYAPDVTASRVERYLGIMVRKELEGLPRKPVEYLTHAGMYKIDGYPVFCTGKAVIQNSTKKANHVIEIASLEENLDVNDDLTEFDAAKEMFDFIILSPEAGQILLAYKLGCFMRMAYEEAGRILKGCIYLYGRTGIQKTTFSSFLIQTYNRSKGIKSPSRLNASVAAAIQILKEKAGDVVILDDLFPAESSKIRKQEEETFIEIIRYIADNTLPAKVRGKKLSQESPKCGVIFTGEYIIGKGSDAARILPVEMIKPDVRKLQDFQKRPVSVSTFYFHYISWFIEHYDEICGIIKKMWEIYANTDLGVHDRLREMHFFLSTAYFFFLQFCFEKAVLSQLDANRLYQSFNELLTVLVKQQNERVQMKMPKQFEDINYWKRIRELYRNKHFNIADSIDNFDKNQHDSIIHRNCLYFRGECFARFFPNIDPMEIIGELEKERILQVGKDVRTKQISRLNGLRFYVIPLKCLT